MAASPKKAKPAKSNGGEAVEGGAVEGGAVELSAGSVRAIAEAVAEKLVEIGPKLARLAAADTIHSIERPETLFRRAIEEGARASALLSSGAGEAKP